MGMIGQMNIVLRIKKLKEYFSKFHHLQQNFGFICFRVGKKENYIKYSQKQCGIIFEVPRNSLMDAITYEIFDDLLIGNFMKTTLVNINSLYPHFSPYVAKYGDNGFSKSKNELDLYFEYYRLNSIDFWKDMFKFKTENIIRNSFSDKSIIFNSARKIKNLIF